ncbi:MAG TPA: TetR/AcrR family transcriptional regulator [Pseudonocardiaceae bacterium]
MSEVTRPVRTRDPARKERILSAAADLVARRGYHAVGMADIGAAAGVTGAAIYRHFESKSAVLVALFDRVIDQLLDNAGRIVEEARDVRAALTLLVRDQVRFAIEDREVLVVYMNEINNLPDEDRRRLRRKQRLYLEEWVHVLRELRPELTDTETRAIVHAAIGVIQSVLHYRSDLPKKRLAELITSTAHAALGVAEVPAT